MTVQDVCINIGAEVTCTELIIHVACLCSINYVRNVVLVYKLGICYMYSRCICRIKHASEVMLVDVKLEEGGLAIVRSSYEFKPKDRKESADQNVFMIFDFTCIIFPGNFL